MEINDVIHGFIYIDNPIIIKIIESDEFKELKYKKQLGCLCYASNNKQVKNLNRYDHCIGTYYLTNKVITHLKESQPELDITDRQVLCVSVAALTHDIGHGPFSHLMDSWLVKTVEEFPEHEIRSGKILHYLNQKYSLEFSVEEIKLMQQIIHPPTRIPKDTPYLFEIVANKVNNFDFDKFDYILRDSYILLKKNYSESFNADEIISRCKVINGHLVYHEKHYLNIVNIFFMRYKLHKEHYNNPRTRAADLKMHQILSLVDEVYHISDLAHLKNNEDIENFCALTDKKIVKYIHMIPEANVIYDQLLTKQFKKCIATIRISGDGKDIENILKENNVDIVVIGLVSGNKKNPLNEIMFYQDVDTTKSLYLNNLLIFQDIYQECLIYVYEEEGIDISAILSKLNLEETSFCIL